MIVPIILLSLFVCGGVFFIIKNFKKPQKSNGGSVTIVEGGSSSIKETVNDKYEKINKELPIHKIEKEPFQQIKINKD